MKNNEGLQKDVQNAIKWEPLMNAAEIGVTAKDGIVTLTGVVDSYAKKLEAEKATKNVTGVKAIIEKIEIRFNDNGQQSYDNIAEDALSALKWKWEVPSDKVKVKVEDGWITLEGELTWNYQKEAAKKAVDNLLGVKGIINNITIKSQAHDEIEKKDIEDAFLRDWSLLDKDIKVKVSGNNVTLNGTVHSIYEKDQAERLAWGAPGVWQVDNELEIDYNF